jgi:hypothetical protein
MHVPGSRTVSHWVKRFVEWPLVDAWYALFARRARDAQAWRRLFASSEQRSEASPPHTATFDPTDDAAFPAFTLVEWARIVEALSEGSSRFFSDNLVSNESSYLQVSADLEGVPKGLAYLGVGPEQNFSYIATVEPTLAFVIDRRRDNLVLHLLYKAIFELASTRSEWLSLLLGRKPIRLPAEEALSLEAVLRQVESAPRSDIDFESSHSQVRTQVATMNGFLSRPVSLRNLKRIHRRFFQAGLDLAFQLHCPGLHRYPSLRSLLLAQNANGQARSFLASPERYARVRRLQCANRLLPIVGDFTGHRAFTGIGHLLRQQRSSIGLVYASNVEQMIWEEQRWKHWLRNLHALPTAAEAILVRSYIDQGRPHPKQMLGHRTTTLAQSVNELLARERRRPFKGHWDVVTRAEGG